MTAPTCATCGHELTCLRCAGRRGGSQRTEAQLEAVRKNIRKAIAARWTKKARRRQQP